MNLPVSGIYGPVSSTDDTDDPINRPCGLPAACGQSSNCCTGDSQ